LGCQCHVCTGALFSRLHRSGKPPRQRGYSPLPARWRASLRKSDDLLLGVTNLSRFVIKNGSRFRRILSVLPPSVFLSTYLVALLAAFELLDIDTIGQKIYI